jgi:formylglycine-generating enzyme required for sulfatase activity
MAQNGKRVYTVPRYCKSNTEDGMKFSPLHRSPPLVFLFLLGIFYGCLWDNSDANKTKIPGGMTLVSAKGHSFQMGDSISAPLHEVVFTYDFYMDQTEVTQADYRSLMDTNPSYFNHDSQRPVERVTWYDAIIYCNRRSQRDGLDTVYRFSALSRMEDGFGVDSMIGLVIDYTKKGYRLPTEAEWEYAYRGGTQSVFYWGNNPDSTGDYSWYAANSRDSTQPVAQKKPNTYGLYDMAGNVYEWIADWYDDYTSSPETDPRGAAEGALHALRGGCWFNTPQILRAAHRGKEPANDRNLDVGFRCALTK